MNLITKNLEIMKTKNVFYLVLVFAIIFASCEMEENIKPEDQSILPDKFMVDIPDAISKSASKKSASASEDTISGDEIYAHLATFIHIGEEAAEVVQEIIWAIAIYEINKPMTISYESDDDGRVKNLEVIEDAVYQGVDYEFRLTATDAESESNPDGGKAMQIFWNRNPVKGVAVLKPYNIDRNTDDMLTDVMYEIYYSEEGEVNGYEAVMIVQIDEFPAELFDDKFAMDALKMFVGKKGDIIDVYGNSNHPNAQFFSEEVGFNWAFVASGKESLDIGVAELGLPPSTLDETRRSILLEEYSVKNVLTDEINTWFLETWGVIPDSASLSGYLKNADDPGYFDSEGFVSGGNSPGSEYNDIEKRLSDLVPYNPKDISELLIEFE